MNNYDKEINIYFDNIDKEVERFKQIKSSGQKYTYKDKKCYKDGFKAFKNKIISKYNKEYKIDGNFTKRYTSGINPNIVIKKYDTNKEDGIYIYVFFPTESSKREILISLELGGNKKNDHVKNANLLYSKIEKDVLELKTAINEYGNVNVNTEYGELIVIEISNYDYIDLILEKFSESYKKVLNDLDIKDWENSWNMLRNEVFGDDVKMTNNNSKNNDANNFCNIIYYGGPGCGKSKHVELTYCKKNKCKDKNGKLCDNYIRTTFYPEYTNSDFVGQLIPKRNENGLDYVINPGPFTKALELALLNKSEYVYLIIEEINRGNAAAIFGDIFQLLDRAQTKNDGKIIGESEYEISNSIIEDYFRQEGIDYIPGNVKIPSNMFIIATMNTSDQNVYTLDSAFKRRWKMEYISNQFSDKPYDKELKNMIVPMKTDDKLITWSKFVKNINLAIIEQNTFGINSEDKQIGKYFVGTCDLVNKKKLKNEDLFKTTEFKEAAKVFAEKVMMYIWEDIAKIKPSDWFNEDIKTFESLLDKYEKNGIDVFNEKIKGFIVSDDNEGK